MKRPTLIKPDGMGMSTAQLECIGKLEEALESAKDGQILALVLVAVGPGDFGIAIAGADAPRLNLSQAFRYTPVKGVDDDLVGLIALACLVGGSAMVILGYLGWKFVA